MGQTARLSVVNNGDIEATETLSIVDSTGRTLATQTLSIAPGGVGSLDYSSPGDIHGIVACIFPASLQIINTRTNTPVALVENFQAPSLDKATLTSPSIGLTAGQTARLTVVNNGDTEVTETLSIADSAGRVVASQTLSIAPASVGSLDYASPGDIHGIVPCIIPASLQIINTRTNKTVALVENFLSGP